ncbi:phosphotransferase [Nonomuraea recticatena]|uniref:Aminoglycoside phosphotransferase domain-containing protein n=1 Tax=Nonomuraea recticatena TaxID=46178 RepID=A0ABN3RLK3_9ACTN
MSGRFVRYPPGRGNVWIPVDDARSCAAGLSLLTFSRPMPLTAQRILHAGARLAGPWILPGRRERWDAEPWLPVLKSAEEAIGPFDGYAVYHRPQASREGAALLLLRSGRPVGFLKARARAREVEREAEVLQMLAGGRRPGFRVPELMGTGSADGMAWLVMSPMEPIPCRPARNVPAAEVAAQITSLLAGLPRPEGVAAHWEPMHGDLTPWNLRMTRGPVPWLIDWEDAGHGPPGADEVYYLATRAAVFGGAVTPTDHLEAADYWRAVVIARQADDRGLTDRLLTALDRLGG